MDKKLEEYRKKKEREEFIAQTKEKFQNFFSRPRKNDKKMEDQYRLIPTEENNRISEEVAIQDDCDLSSEPDIDDTSLNCFSYTELVYYGLCFALWLVVYYIFITFQFGTVYFLLSALIGMYLNTRTSPKKPHEVSAYSVFNENCKSIDGTLKGEQFEREMGYRI